MYYLYNIVVYIVGLILKLIVPFNKKIELFVNGRKESFLKLSSKISKKDQVIWIHSASLGEFEQGRPIVEKLREIYPSKKIVVTFFSPSGYEIRKDYNGADVVCYLPLDSIYNAKKFMNIVQPELAIFVKYEFWPNFLNELKKREVKTILVSGIFRESQAFFKWYGGWMRKSLQTFSHFFVQEPASKKLLNTAGFKNVTVSGDTRFDRVSEILKQDNNLAYISKFKNNCYTLVAGSTWKEDEDLLVNYINNEASEKEKFIIAPHNIKTEDITHLKNSIKKTVVLFSEKDNSDLKNVQVFIVDTIGILTKIYSYADVAYIGGGYTKSGVHNVLEPATFGIPIVIGPNYSKFNEVVELVDNEACFVVDNSKKITVLLKEFFQEDEKRKKAGRRAGDYVKSKIGATNTLLKYLR
ncbi:3-deoxy-D-manno-octulosonic acid transferase [Lutibacter citreus]|uniref:3-deoxy-D-manno-octulosonic acid transferase n=1 Tax=Lutibacter citreus TaxID=2138210 RepID=UPI000DBE81A6|nr:glycosyltransferase N-terminal domain-containing protein [Lutibacter citreus]